MPEPSARLTRAEVEALSGRALDAAVHQLVMGQKAFRVQADPLHLMWTYQTRTGHQVPVYHDDWSAMKTLVARLTEMVGDDGDHPDIVIETNGVRTMVTIGPIGSRLMTTTVDGPPAEAAPTAVARVALLVVGQA